jgi:hypothetical protein
MATDQVALFDKRRCDQILHLTDSEMSDYLQPHLSTMDRSNRLGQDFDASAPAAQRIARLRKTGFSEEEIQGMMIRSLCISPERISLDYWACYPLVFGEDPPGSIPDYELLPHRQSPEFLLLRADHVQEMLDTLSILRRKLTVMSDTAVAVLQFWKDRCASDPNWMVAYLFKMG